MALLGHIGRNVSVFVGRVRTRVACVKNFKDLSIQPDVRLSSIAAPASPSAVLDNDNEVVSEKFINRNPRNLELLALAVKDRGWRTVWPSRQHWHRVVLSRSQKHVTAQVLSGDPASLSRPVVSASTQEWAVKKHLGPTCGVSACENIGRVLAQRCLEAGIRHATFRAIPWEFRSQSVQKFRDALKEGGLILSEPRRIYK
ncbi:large ribosomal subunit protein uL18m [Lepisosteus oculatus]|uniref:large ribosomal subunit protein uL18m n=1 Tax=Lepisosteus oculatus TaxID=7918 RepID=UPI0037177A81